LYIKFPDFEQNFPSSKEKSFSSKEKIPTSKEKFPMFEEVFRRKGAKKGGQHSPPSTFVQIYSKNNFFPNRLFVVFLQSLTIQPSILLFCAPKMRVLCKT
jgi:hypothetical protein